MLLQTKNPWQPSGEAPQPALAVLLSDLLRHPHCTLNTAKNPVKFNTGLSPLLSFTRMSMTFDATKMS